MVILINIRLIDRRRTYFIKVVGLKLLNVENTYSLLGVGGLKKNHSVGLYSSSLWKTQTIGKKKPAEAGEESINERKTIK